MTDGIYANNFEVEITRHIQKIYICYDYYLLFIAYGCATNIFVIYNLRIIHLLI
jgi:hypothetical protein